MGKIINNPIIESFSGKYSEDLMFRRVNNRTIFVRPGTHKQPASKAQSENRRRFAEVQLYIRQLLKDQDIEEWYACMAKLNGFNSALTAAVKDYMCLPQIATLVTSRYKGQAGDIIIIKPAILMKIRRMDVTIYDTAGSVLETGPAQKSDLHWKYYATTSNPHREESRIQIVAYDRFNKAETFGSRFGTLGSPGSVSNLHPSLQPKR